MTKTTYIDYSKAKPFLKIALPSYTGRKDPQLVTIDKGDQVELFNQEWSGGSNYSYTLINRDTFQSLPIPKFKANTQKITLPDNAVLLTVTYFRGQLMPVTVTAYADSLPKQLAPETSDDQWTLADYIVLYQTVTRKASYAGMNRFEAFNYDKDGSRVECNDMTLEQWTTATDRLKAKKYLRKNGSVTASGRNLKADLDDKFPCVNSWALWSYVADHGFDWKG